MPTQRRSPPRSGGGAAVSWTIPRADLGAGGGEAVRLVHASLPEIAHARVDARGLLLSPVEAPVPLAPLTESRAARYLVRLAGLAAFLKSRGLGIAPEDVGRLGARRDDLARPWLAAPPAPEWRAADPGLVVAAAACRLSGARLESRTAPDLARSVEALVSETRGALETAAHLALRARETRRAPESLVAELAAAIGVGRDVGADLLGIVLPSAFESEPDGLARPAAAFGGGALAAARGFARRTPGTASVVEMSPGPPMEEGGALRRGARALDALGDPRAALLRALAEGERPPRVEAGPPLALVGRDLDLWDPRSRAAWREGLADGIARFEARERGAPWERVEALMPIVDASTVSALVFLPFRALAPAASAWESLARTAGGDLGRLLAASRELASRFDPGAAVPVKAPRASRTARDPVLGACALLLDGFSADEAATAAGVTIEEARASLAAASVSGALTVDEGGLFSFAEESERQRLASRVGLRACADAVSRLEPSGLASDRLLAATLARGSKEDVRAARRRVQELAVSGETGAVLALLERAPASDPDLGDPLLAMTLFDEAGRRARAAESARRLEPDALRAAAPPKRFSAARRLGRLGEVERALALLGSDPPSLLARARVVLDAHREDEAERFLGSARAGGSLSKEEAAEAHLMEAEIAWRRQEFPKAVSALRRGVRSLAARGMEGSLESFATAGVLASDLGRTDEAAAMFRRVKELATDGGTRADAALDLAVTFLHAGRWEDAERELEAALLAYEERGQRDRYLSALGNRVELQILRGDYARAREDLARVLVHDRAPGRDHQFLFSVTARQRLALLDGDLEDAATAFAEAEARPVFVRHAARREALALEAARLLASGEAAAARRRLDEAAAFPDNRLHSEPLLARLAASCAVDLGGTQETSGLAAGESVLVAAERRLRSGEPAGAAALAELSRRARTGAGAGEVVARVLEWSGRFPEAFASDGVEPLLELARRAARSCGLDGARARLASFGRRRAPVPLERHAEVEPAPFVAEDASTCRVLLEVRKVARSRLSVFVHGETGTGKELVAKELHRASGRHPFVAVNVAALAPALVESELFGHARGAFTGADRDRAGLLEAARGGTLFLDEIGDLPLALQAKLLRALQERTVTRVGEVKPRPVDLRVVSASHRDLKALVDAGAFRADLYHRLVQHEVRLEPLRRRPRDLAALVAGNLGAFALVPEARKSLLAYAWPGNVRELLSALESARVLAEPGARIELAHLPASVRGVPERREPITYREILEDAKRSAIVRALEACGGNRTRAASRLGLSRQSLLYDIKKLRIEG